MNELMFKAFGQKYMEAAGDAGGEGGGGGSAAGAGAAGAAADGGNAGGEGGVEGGALTGGGDAGGAGSAAGAGEGGSGTAGGNGEGGDGGALTGQGDAPEAIDWEKLTDEDYVKKLVAPDGQKFNDEVMKAYAPLLRENKIDPKVFQKFLAKDAELQKSFGERRKAEVDAAQAEAKKAFKQAGEDFRKEFTPEQVKEMNTVLAGIDDPTFKTLVTKSPLANNKTIGKMLLAYKKVYGEDSLPTGGTGGQEKTFEQVWTGK